MEVTLDLSAELLARLEAYCREHGTSAEDVLRCAADSWLPAAPLTPEQEAANRAEFERAFDAVFGIWKDRDIDTDSYLAALRSEWDDRFPDIAVESVIDGRAYPALRGIWDNDIDAIYDTI